LQGYRGEYRDKIPATPLLRAMKRSNVLELFSRSELLKLRSEETVIDQGAPGDSIYILLSGSAAAYFTDRFGNKRYLARFRPGDFFGERGFFRDGIRSASVQTVTPAVLLSVPGAVMRDLIKHDVSAYDILYRKFEEREEDFRLKVATVKKARSRSKRKKVEGQVKFHLGGLGATEQKPDFGFLKDISWEGCKIEMDGNHFMRHQADIVGKPIPVSIKLTGATNTISAIGKVSWYEQAHDMDIFGYRVNFGMEFIKLLGDSAEVMKKQKIPGTPWSE